MSLSLSLPYIISFYPPVLLTLKDLKASQNYPECLIFHSVTVICQGHLPIACTLPSSASRHARAGPVGAVGAGVRRGPGATGVAGRSEVEVARRCATHGISCLYFVPWGGFKKGCTANGLCNAEADNGCSNGRLLVFSCKLQA